MQRQIELIGAAWGLGGPEPGCAEAPAALMPMIAAEFQRCGVPVESGPILSPSRTERRRQLAVSKLCGLLASAVADSVQRGQLPCVLGGDHSCAGGTWTGVARATKGNLGLVWIDAHMDAHTPRTSHTGRLHGMPLAWLLGEDDDPLYGLTTGVIEPNHVALIGVRSFEPEEKVRLEHLGVRVIYMEEVARRGIGSVLDEAIAIATRGTKAFGVSIDLDVVTPDEAPAVGTPVPDGVSGTELGRALEGIGARNNLAAIELVEYSPRLDPTGHTARVAVDLLVSALCRSREQPKVVA
ncbi:MAG: arginase [Betaproteobacteria bacterium]|nr:arginase [Betaproteobacteria bacterium]